MIWKNHLPRLEMVGRMRKDRKLSNGIQIKTYLMMRRRNKVRKREIIQ